MIKNSVSIAIIIIAIVIVFFNFNESKQIKTVTPIAHSANETTDATEEIDETEETETTAQPAPDFTLETLDGTKVALSDFKGQKVLLNFWATWCPPCRAEMPHMQSFYEKNKDENIVVLAVNLTSGDNREKLAPFISEYSLTFPILLDESGDIGRKYQVFTIPTSYFIDEQGNIAQKIVGPMDEEFMENVMNSF